MLYLSNTDMKRIFILFLLALVFVISPSAQAMEMNSSELSSAHPAILPNNLFYSIKSWVSNVQKLFTQNNKEKDVLLSTQELSLKATEIKLMQGASQTSLESINKAKYSYQNSLNLLVAKITALQPSDIVNGVESFSKDGFLNYLVERMFTHTEFLNQLIALEQNEDMLIALQDAKGKINEALMYVANNLDTTTAFFDRLSIVAQSHNSTLPNQFGQTLLNQESQ